MADEKLQAKVAEVFEGIFGRTPLGDRLNDILSQAIRLNRMTDIRNLREKAGDLLASTIALCHECGWDFEAPIEETLQKIRHRESQYRSLGRKLRVAILGGAFDPVTTGHIQLAQTVLNASSTFDEVCLMPCFRHMNGKKMASAEHRSTMCQIAAKADGRIKVFDFEIERQLAGQTYHFVKLLLEDERYKDQYDFSIIMGMDNANTFPTWPDFAELERMIRFVVVPRAGVERNEAVGWYLKPPHIYLAQENNVPVTSSTSVRTWLSKRWQDNAIPRSVEIDQNVLDYILANNLYQ